jgi:hypothetical protein
MTRIMRDAVNPNNIPLAGAQLFAGYDNGRISQWPADAWKKFPSGSTVHIDVDGTNYTSDVIDVEQGNSTVSNGFALTVGWVKAKQGHAFLPICYANRSTLTPMFNALNAAGLVVGKHFLLWIATLDGTKTVPDMTGVVAVQYTDHANLYDESIVYRDDWKAPVVPPVPVKNGYLVEVAPIATIRMVHSQDGGKTWL